MIPQKTAETPKAPDLDIKGVDKGKENYYTATQFQLMWLKFRRHRMAIIGSITLGIFVFIMIFCEFLAPYGSQSRDADYLFGEPQKMHFFTQEGKLRSPFVYGMTTSFNKETMQIDLKEDFSDVRPVSFFAKGEPYKMWGLFKGNLHLFTVDGGFLHVAGTDSLGRDVFSRMLYGTRTSLSIGFIGVLISFIVGLALGGISGYFGGFIDSAIQRLIEFIRSIPTLPLWMSLAAVLPKEWSAL